MDSNAFDQDQPLGSDLEDYGQEQPLHEDNYGKPKVLVT
jgi:hypothetical protein